MLDVCLAGTAGMVPLPDRWLTTLYLASQGSSVLIDCGEGTQVALAESKCRLRTIDVICLTHFHADHCAGLPGLLLSMGNAGRTEPITIVGPTGLRHVLSSLLIIANAIPFEIAAVEIDPNDMSIRDGFVQAGPMVIRAFPVDHLIPCLGYTVEIERSGKFDVEKAKSLGIPKEYWGKLQKGENVTYEGTTYMPNSVLGEKRKGIKLLYSTDTRPVKGMVKYGQDADLMILEGNYEDDQKMEKAEEWGHMTFPEAAKVAAKAKAKELWLTHFSQSIKDPEEFIDNARDIFRNTYCGRDGMKKTLDFSDE